MRFGNPRTKFGEHFWSLLSIGQYPNTKSFMPTPLRIDSGTESAPRTHKAVLAWHEGESGGSYRNFRDLLASNFDYFSHPFIGSKRGSEALETLNSLLIEREKYPGTLGFREILCFEQSDVGIVRYRSSGIVAGAERTPYDGPAVILFFFSGTLIRGFEEALGWFDPCWHRS
jgi:hypothetical protein